MKRVLVSQSYGRYLVAKLSANLNRAQNINKDLTTCKYLHLRL